MAAQGTRSLVRQLVLPSVSDYPASSRLRQAGRQQRGLICSGFRHEALDCDRSVVTAWDAPMSRVSGLEGPEKWGRVRSGIVALVGACTDSRNHMML